MARSPSPRARSYSRSRSRSPIPSKRARSIDSDADKDAQAERCPFLIRVYVTKGKHTPLIDFDDGKPPHRDEFTVYGWKHSTPTSLIQSLYPAFPAPYRSPQAKFSFRHVYVDATERGLYRFRDLVTFSGRDFMATAGPIAPATAVNADNGDENMAAEPTAPIALDRELGELPEHNRKAGPVGRKVEEKSLDDYGFITGDLLSVSVNVPEPRGPIAAAIAGAGTGNAAGAPLSIRGTSSAYQPRGGPRPDSHGHDGPPHRHGHWIRSGAPLTPQGAGGRGPPAPAGSWRDPPSTYGHGSHGHGTGPYERGDRRDGGGRDDRGAGAGSGPGRGEGSWRGGGPSHGGGGDRGGYAPRPPRESWSSRREQEQDYGRDRGRDKDREQGDGQPRSKLVQSGDENDIYGGW